MRVCVIGDVHRVTICLFLIHPIPTPTYYYYYCCLRLRLLFCGFSLLKKDQQQLLIYYRPLSYPFHWLVYFCYWGFIYLCVFISWNYIIIMLYLNFRFFFFWFSSRNTKIKFFMWALFSNFITIYNLFILLDCVCVP